MGSGSSAYLIFWLHPLDSHWRLMVHNESRHRIVLSLICFAGGYICLASFAHLCIVRLTQPISLYAEGRNEKLEILRLWRGRAASAAFGSSHVNNGFDPRAFDSVLAGTRLATTTINLGIEGGSQTEQHIMAREFLNTRPDCHLNGSPCFVLLELNAGTNFVPRFLFHPRAINIYDLSNIRLALSFADRSEGLKRWIGRAGYALAAGALYYGNTGMLSNLIFHPSLNRTLLSSETANDRRGQLNEAMPLGVAKALRQVFATRGQTPSVLPQSLPVGYTVLPHLLDSETGGPAVQYVFFVTPSARDLHQRPLYPAELPGPHGPIPVLDVADPVQHPDLYDFANWQDDSHLNPRGAALYSTLLAHALLAWCSNQPATTPCGG